MAEHARFAPSGLDRIAACPASVSLCSGLPPDDSPKPHAERGTMLHALLADRVNDALGRPRTAMLEGYSEEGLNPVDRRALDVAWDYVKSHPAMTPGPGHSVWVEQRVEVGRWCGLDEGCLWGTADLILVTADCLEVADAKFGSIPVHPDGLQLRAYAVGAGRLLVDPESKQFRPEYRQVRTVKLTIVQPSQPQPVNTLAYSLDSLMTWSTQIGKVIREALQPNPKFAPSGQCHWCRGKEICAAYAGEAAAAAREIAGIAPPPPVAQMFDRVAPGVKCDGRMMPEGHGVANAGTLDAYLPGPPEPLPVLAEVVALKDPGPPEPPTPPAKNGGFLQDIVQSLLSLNADNPTLEEQGKILDLVPILEEYLATIRKAAEKTAMDRLMRGEEFPGWKLVNGRRSREWNTSDTKALSDAFGRFGIKAADLWEKKIRTPPQLEKVLADRPETLRKVEKYVVWKEGKPVLAPASDPRAGYRDPATMFEVTPETADKPDWM